MTDKTYELIAELEKLWEEAKKDPTMFFKGTNRLNVNLDRPAEVAGLACDALITRGGNNLAAFKIMAEHGYEIYAGEKDSFGWLSGCIEKDNIVLIYG